MINLGALISFTLVAYVCQYGISTLGGISWAFFIGFNIPLIMMTLGVCIFVSGAKRYKLLQPSGSILEYSLKIIYEAVWTQRNKAYDQKLFHTLDKAKKVNGGSYNDDEVEGIKKITKLGMKIIIITHDHHHHHHHKPLFFSLWCPTGGYIPR